MIRAVAGASLLVLIVSAAAPVPKLTKKDQWLIVKGDGVCLFTEGDKQPTKLTKDRGSYGEAGWSPDGKRIAFACTRPRDSRQIFTMDADGGSLSQLTAGDGDYGGPNWSPDGKSLLFHRAGKKGKYQIGEMDATTGQVSRVLLDDGQFNFMPHYSPDGKAVAYIRNKSAWVMDADGKNAKELAPSTYPHWLDWSPDGKRLVLPTRQDRDDVQLHAVGRSGDGLKRLTAFEKKVPMCPSWSPDGTRIAFVVHDSSTGTERHAVWVMDADGENQRELVDTTSAADTYFVHWRPR